MTHRRSQFLPAAVAAFATLAISACFSTSGSGDDDSSTSGKGAVLGCAKDTDCRAPRICQSGECVDPGAGGTGGGTGGSATGGSATGGTTGGNASGGKGGGTSGAGGTDTGTGGASGGTGGATGGSSGAGTGGSTAGTGGSSTTGNGLGDSCASTADCASGLTCIPPDDDTLGGLMVPNGICTLACMADSECSAFDPGAFCVAFDEAQTILYCLQSCITGTPGVPKCQERTDFACSYLGVTDTAVECTTSDDCGDTQICDTDTGFCGDPVTGCVPMCGGDFDCQSGQYCDFLSGMCTPGTADDGLAIGEECDPSATTVPCAGFCSALDSAGTAGVCSGFCSLNEGLIGCGWSGTGAADAACLFGTRLSPPGDSAPGDIGLCGALCDCNDDCLASAERCVDDSDGLVMDVWGRAGYCRPLSDTETEADSIACN